MVSWCLIPSLMGLHHKFKYCRLSDRTLCLEQGAGYQPTLTLALLSQRDRIAAFSGGRETACRIVVFNTTCSLSANVIMNDLSRLYASGVVHGSVLVATITADQLRDATLVYALRDELISLLNATGAQSLVLDLEKVRYIGSIGFLAFLGVRRHLGGARIVLCNMSEPTRQMFSVCRLIPTDTTNEAPFEVDSTVPSALTRLGAVTGHEGK